MGEDIIEFDGIRDTMQGIIKVVGVGGGGTGTGSAPVTLASIPPSTPRRAKRPSPPSPKNSFPYPPQTILSPLTSHLASFTSHLSKST